MKIKGTKESHIQIPKLLLKEFSTPISIVNEMGRNEKPKMVYKLNMSGNITQVDIKKENTELGYYEDLIETKILPSIEVKFGALKTKILNYIKNKDKTITFDNNDIDVVRKFCSLCLVRSQSVVKDVSEKSLFMNMLCNAPQNVVAYQYFKMPELVDKYIIGNNISFVENKTNINYVLPRLYVIAINQQNGIFDYFIPISPKILIRLTTEKTYDANILYVGTMTKEAVDNFNKFAIKSEFSHNYCAVYAKNKEDLERYVKFIISLSN